MRDFVPLSANGCFISSVYICRRYLYGQTGGVAMSSKDNDDNSVYGLIACKLEMCYSNLPEAKVIVVAQIVCSEVQLSTAT